MDHLLTINDLSTEDINNIFKVSEELKKEYKSGKIENCMQNKTLGMIFEKPSMRTRVSFEVGMTQMGGHAIFLGPESFSFGKRESVKDIARVMSRYVDQIMVRTFAHSNVLELAEHSSVPVINGLCDWEHPCQALADIMTMKEIFGDLEGRKLTFLGDGNNVARSLALTCYKLGIEFVHSGPEGYDLTDDFLNLIPEDKKHLVKSIRDPKEACENADIVYTDVWASMGQESEAQERAKLFRPYQLNVELLECGKPGLKALHCLPAHRGDEITDEVMDGDYAAVYDEAENRLHVQKGIMKVLMK